MLTPRYVVEHVARSYDKLERLSLRTIVLRSQWQAILGYRCDKNRDCYSVPYAIGNLVGLLADPTEKNDCHYKKI